MKYYIFFKNVNSSPPISLAIRFANGYNIYDLKYLQDFGNICFSAMSDFQVYTSLNVTLKKNIVQMYLPV